MIITKGATVLDRWLAQEKGWNKVHQFKPRNTATKQTNDNNTSNHNTKVYQQTDLQGRVIDVRDGNAFGDIMTTKPEKAIRVMSQNIGGLPATSTHYKSHQVVNQVCHGDADVWLMQEIGLCWPLVHSADKWKERTRTKAGRRKAIFGYNKTEIEESEPLQAGGVAVIATSSMTPRCKETGVDPSGLGRWAWTRIEGIQGRHVRFVSVYRPCKPSSQGIGTVWEQHRRTFKTDRNPREALLEDIESEIMQWQELGDVIILGMDANEDTRSKGLKKFFGDLNMKNVILDHHKGVSPPATHSRNMQREPIDGLWVSKGIDPIAAGFLPVGDGCPSDHVALWADFRISDLLGANPESVAVKIKRMKADDPRLVSKYNKRAKEELAKQDVLRRLTRLSKVSTANWKEEHVVEFNLLQNINTQVRRLIGDNIRKVCMGNIPWSPRLQRFYDRIELMKMVVNKRQGLRSSMTKIRRLMSLTSDWNVLKVDLAGAKTLLNEAFTNYKDARKEAPEWRNEHLDDLDEAKAKKNKTSIDKERKQRKEIERQRKRSQVVKNLRNKTRHAVTKLYFTTENNERIECTTKNSMETACITENERRFSQTEDNPPMQEEILHLVGLVAEEEGANQILEGTFITPPDCDPYLAVLIEEMRMERKAKEAGIISPLISIEEHIQGWRRQKERTASVSSGLSFSDHKAAIEDKDMAETDRLLREIPYSRGFSPELYQVITDFEILKKAGVYDVEKMRTIQLFVAQFNMNNKKSGRDVMRRAEELGLIPKEQAGSRKHHRSVLSALNKVLTMDLLRLRRQAGALCSNDAKSCYDRIVHWVAALCMRRLGLSKEASMEMFLTLTASWHYIATAYGESKRRYGGTRYPPLQGVGQGNGAGPMIWAVISAVLIAIMRRFGHGISILTPLTMSLLYVVCFAFVDDTDVVHAGTDVNTDGEQVRCEMQEVVDRWEGSVRATGGALVPSKSYWYLIDFEWKKGSWRYRSKSSMPGEISIRGVDGIRVTLTRLEPSEARETLGVFIAMDGNWREEVESLKEKSIEFAEQLRTGWVKPNDAWYAFNATVMKSLEYPMEAIYLTKKDWEEIMRPMVTIVLQRSRIAGTFPRDVFYSPTKFQGLAVMHPWYRQQIVHLITLFKESTARNPTGELLLANVEQTRLEMGVSGPLTSPLLSLMEPYLTTSWLKDLLLFLNQYGIAIEDPVPKLQKARLNDQFLMEFFISQGYRGKELSSLQSCRQALQVTTLAEIVTIDGESIIRNAWIGKRIQPEVVGWPRKPTPSRSEWQLWQVALTPLLRSPRSFRLEKTLGEWTTPPPLTWKWFFSPSEQRLYSKHGAIWRAYRTLSRRGGLRHGGDFEIIPNFCLSIPEDLQRADVESTRSAFRLKSSSGWLTVPSPNTPSTIEEARDCIVPNDRWALEDIQHTDNGQAVADAIREGTAYAVSDGSFKQKRGTSAFLLEGTNGAIGRILGANEIPGSELAQSAYRSELGGISGVIATVDCLCRLYSIQSGKIRCGLDGEQAMLHASGSDPLDPRQASFDLLVDIRNKLKKSPISWEFFWIEGHQKERHGSSTAWGDLNEICDAAAKIFWNYVSLTRPPTPNHRFGDEEWSVTIQGEKLAKITIEGLYSFTFGEEFSKPYWVRKHFPVPQLFTNIHWEACGVAFQNMPFGKKRWLVKFLTGFCAVGRVMKRREKWQHDLCPLCLTPNESVHHINICRDARARLQWLRSVDTCMVRLAKIDTDPDIIRLIRNRLMLIRSVRVNRFSIPAGTSKAIRIAGRAQDAIGWNQFLRGRLSRLWMDAQELWLVARATRYKKSSSLWMSRTVEAALQISWEMWEHRNAVLHHPKHPWNLQVIKNLDECILHEISRYREQRFLLSDRRLFRATAEHMLATYSAERKQQWIHSVWMARLRKTQTQELSMKSSRLCMENWLSRDTSIPE